MNTAILGNMIFGHRVILCHSHEYHQTIMTMYKIGQSELLLHQGGSPSNGDIQFIFCHLINFKKILIAF